MGLFDKAKKSLGDALSSNLSNKVVKAVEKATGLDLDQDGQAGSQATQPGFSRQPVPAPGQQEAYRSAPAYSPPPVQQVTEKPYFRAILQDCFYNYIIREDVPVAELGGTGKPYDFALFSGGECCGVVVLVAHNRDNNRAYLGGKAAAIASGVPFINFYTHMPNERGFVINRIRRLAKPAV